MKTKLGIAAAIALVACSAFASNFRVADQVYVPGAGHLAGSGGTFITDVFVSNLSGDTVTVTVYGAQGEQGALVNAGNPPTFQLQPYERKEFVDFVGTPTSQGGLGQTTFFGQLIFNGCATNSAGCGPSTQDPNTGVSPNFRNISVESRTYSIPAGAVLGDNPPTTGQLFSGLPWYSYVSETQKANGLDKVFVTGIRSNALYRTNVGFVNASQFSNTTITVKLFQGANQTPLGTFTKGLGPLGFYTTSVTNMFPGVTFNAGSATPGATSSYYVTVEQSGSSAISSDPNVVPTSCQPSGCPGFFAFGSVLDNKSNDATTLESQYLAPLTDAQINCIYPAPNTAACKGTPAVHRASRH